MFAFFPLLIFCKLLCILSSFLTWSPSFTVWNQHASARGPPRSQILLTFTRESPVTGERDSCCITSVLKARCWLVRHDLLSPIKREMNSWFVRFNARWIIANLKQWVHYLLPFDSILIFLFSSCTKDYFWLIAWACGSKNRSVDRQEWKGEIQHQEQELREREDEVQGNNKTKQQQQQTKQRITWMGMRIAESRIWNECWAWWWKETAAWLSPCLTVTTNWVKTECVNKLRNVLQVSGFTMSRRRVRRNLGRCFVSQSGAHTDAACASTHTHKNSILLLG